MPKGDGPATRQASAKGEASGNGQDLLRGEGLKKLRLRVLVAVAGIVVLLAALFLGDLPFALVLAAIIGLALNEFYALFRSQHYRPNEVLGLIGGVALPLAAYAFGLPGVAAVLCVTTIAGLVWYVAFSSTTFADISVTLSGVLYVGFLLSFLVLTRLLQLGIWLVMLVFVAVWVNDIVAYFVGVTVGRTKLAPRISPGKTWEGTVAGIAASAGILAALYFVPQLDAFERAILGGVVGLVAIFGDLAESRVKRELGVKDSSKMLPGHGGFLDRFDSLLFASGAGYYLFTALFKLR